MGSRLFANNCATCHGSDARGGRATPTSPTTTGSTAARRRSSCRPSPMAATASCRPWEPRRGRAGRQGDGPVRAQPERPRARRRHGGRGSPEVRHDLRLPRPEGKGNQAMGAPNLTDDIWLHGGRVEHIEEQITLGRNNQMPAHRDILGTREDPPGRPLRIQPVEFEAVDSRALDSYWERQERSEHRGGRSGAMGMSTAATAKRGDRRQSRRGLPEALQEIRGDLYDAAAQEDPHRCG